jgi:hypothetical protein
VTRLWSRRRRKYFTLGACTVSTIGSYYAASSLLSSCTDSHHARLPITTHHPVYHIIGMPRRARPHPWRVRLRTSRLCPRLPRIVGLDFPPIRVDLTLYNISHIPCRMADVKVLTWSYKLTGEIARRVPHIRGDHPRYTPRSRQVAQRRSSRTRRAQSHSTRRA